MAARLRRLLPWLESTDAATVRAWCELELLAAACSEILFEHGITRPDGRPDPLLGELRNIRRVQLQYGMALGLNPAARKMLAAGGAPGFAALDISEAQAERAIAAGERVVNESIASDARGEANEVSEN